MTMRVLARKGPAMEAPRTIQLDLRGLSNPEPVLALAEAAGHLAPGEQLVVVADDPCATIDFLRWVAGTDLGLVELRSMPGEATEYVFRLPLAAEGPR